MRSMIHSASQLSSLRSSLRSDVTVPSDSERVVEGFVAAVNEVVSAGIATAVDGAAIDVRWQRRTQPHVELCAEIRNAAGTPPSLTDPGLPARILHHAAERVDIEERIGGSVITVRCRV